MNNSEVDYEKLNQKESDILSGIQNQIAVFDNKSAILISVIGIIFAFSLNIFDVFNNIIISEIEEARIVWFYVFVFLYFLYFISAILSVCFAVMVIFPRGHNGKKVNVNYYGDIPNMSSDEFLVNLQAYASRTDLIYSQILINSNICVLKHKLLRTAIYLMVPFGTLLSAVIFGLVLMDF